MISPAGLRSEQYRGRRPTRLATSVVADLIDAVVGGRLAVGAALPSEQALCDEFEVSRIVVREALKSLEQKGLVLIRQGQATVVAPAAQWNPLDEDVLDARIRHDESLTVLDNLVHVRVALESEMAAAAASRRSAQDAEELRRLLAELAGSLGDHIRYQALDLAFHDRVMRTSGNDVGQAIVSGIHEHARASSRYSGGTPTPEHLGHAQAGHAAIAEAVCAGDEHGAREAMRAHILEAWDLKAAPSARKARGR